MRERSRVTNVCERAHGQRKPLPFHARAQSACGCQLRGALMRRRAVFGRLTGRASGRRSWSARKHWSPASWKTSTACTCSRHARPQRLQSPYVLSLYVARAPAAPASPYMLSLYVSPSHPPLLSRRPPLLRSLDAHQELAPQSSARQVLLLHLLSIVFFIKTRLLLTPQLLIGSCTP